MAATPDLAGNALAGLQEIPLPPPVSYAPQTMGWLILGILLVAAISALTWRIVRHRRANAYRREALAELAVIEHGVRRLDGPDLLRSATQLPALLKRTALAAMPRSQVAALTGNEWLRFLDRSLGSPAFDTDDGRVLTRLAYQSCADEPANRAQLQSLIALTRRWIKHHHAHV